MKSLFSILILLLMFASLSLAATHRIMPKDEVNARQSLINDIYSDQASLQYTCDRVQTLSQGEISKENCNQKLKKTNKNCEKIAKKSSQYFNTEHDVKQLVYILVSCPIAKIMGYNYSIQEGSPLIKEAH